MKYNFPLNCSPKSLSYNLLSGSVDRRRWGDAVCFQVQSSVALLWMSQLYSVLVSVIHIILDEHPFCGGKIHHFFFLFFLRIHFNGSQIVRWSMVYFWILWAKIFLEKREMIPLKVILMRTHLQFIHKNVNKYKNKQRRDLAINMNKPWS